MSFREFRNERNPYMLKRFQGILAIGTLLLLGSSHTISAQARRPSTEQTYIGITLLRSSYGDVLRRYGKPHEIQAGSPVTPLLGAPEGRRPASTAQGSGDFGGGPALGGGGRRSGGPSSGGPSAGGAFGGSRSIPSGGGALPGFGGAPGSGGAFGGSRSIPSGGGAIPGFGGAPGSGGDFGGGLPGGGGDPGSDGQQSTDDSIYETTWWYHYPKDGLHRMFLFNREGRVIQISEYGFDKNLKSGTTARGVRLRSTLGQVLSKYGWNNEGNNTGTNLLLRYGGEYKVAFQLLNNVVRGITVAVVKEPPAVTQTR